MEGGGGRVSIHRFGFGFGVGFVRSFTRFLVPGFPMLRLAFCRAITDFVTSTTLFQIFTNSAFRTIAWLGWFVSSKTSRKTTASLDALIRTKWHGLHVFHLLHGFRAGC